MWRIVSSDETLGPKYLVVGSRDLAIWHFASLGAKSQYEVAAMDKASTYE